MVTRPNPRPHQQRRRRQRPQRWPPCARLRGGRLSLASSRPSTPLSPCRCAVGPPGCGQHRGHPARPPSSPLHTLPHPSTPFHTLSHPSTPFQTLPQYPPRPPSITLGHVHADPWQAAEPSHEQALGLAKTTTRLALSVNQVRPPGNARWVVSRHTNSPTSTSSPRHPPGASYVMG